MRVVIADDAVILREGLARLLAEVGMTVVGQAADAEELLAAVAAEKPDVAVVDIRMPPTHTDEGLRAAREIRRRHPEVGILVLSQFARPSYALELLADGAEGVGYLLKDRVSDLAELAESLRRIAAGGSVLDPSVVSQLVGRPLRGRDPLEDLTPREREILTLVGHGLSNDEIAEHLVISPATARTHVSRAMLKLSARDRAQLVVFAYESGLVAPGRSVP